MVDFGILYNLLNYNRGKQSNRQIVVVFQPQDSGYTKLYLNRDVLPSPGR